MQYIVTVKLGRNPNHDPRDKQTGECILSTECTDVTGEHHSALVSEEELARLRSGPLHITRVERVPERRQISFTADLEQGYDLSAASAVFGKLLS